MSIGQKDQNSILKFLETTRFSLKNLRLKGDNVFSHRCLAANVLFSPQKPVQSPRKMTSPNYTIKKVSVVHAQTITKSKDLRDKREDMAVKLCELIEEINAVKSKKKSSIKVIYTIMNFLRSCFEIHEGFGKIFDFLENSIMGTSLDFSPSVKKHFESLYFEIPEKFVFKDILLNYLEESLSTHLIDNGKIVKQLKRQLKARAQEMEELISQKKKLEEANAINLNNINSLGIIRKEKFDLIREVIKCKFEIIDFKEEIEKLQQENQNSKSSEELLHIKTIEYKQQLKEMTIQMTDIREKFKITKAKSNQRKERLRNAEKAFSKSLQKIKCTNELLESMSSIFSNRIIEIRQTCFKSVSIAEEKEPKHQQGSRKPSRFSISKKNRKNSVESPKAKSDKKSFPVNMLNPFVDSKISMKKSNEEIFTSETDQNNPQWISEYESDSSLKLKRMISVKDTKMQDMAKLWSRCSISSSLANSFVDFLFVITSNLAIAAAGVDIKL
jgi:hypothetical protein